MKKLVMTLVAVMILTTTPVYANSTADKTWDYLTDDMGLNKYCAAGIMGNMMHECGRNTLSLDHKAHNKSHYGLCQWSKKYYKKVWKSSLDYQLKLLKKDIKKQFDTYGKRYKKGFNYSKFKKLKNEKEAAKAFYKCYERGGSKKCSKQMKNATKALKEYS